MAAISPAAAWGILVASAIVAGIAAILLLRGPYWVVRRTRGDPIGFWSPGVVVIGMLATLAWIATVFLMAASIDVGGSF